jgi:hypothetical protein
MGEKLWRSLVFLSGIKNSKRARVLKTQMKTMFVTLFNIKDVFTLNSFHKAKHSAKLIMWKSLKQLCKAVCRKCPEVWLNNWILHHDYAVACKALSVRQFLAQKSITEMEHSPCSPYLFLNNFCLFPHIKSALEGQRFEDIENTHKNVMVALKSYSAAGVPKMFPTVATSLGKVHSCSRGILLR